MYLNDQNSIPVPTSRCRYLQLRDDFQLPSRSYLIAITSKVKTIEDFSFFQSIFSNWADPRQKDCVLILDEVYIKSTLQYHGGSIFGEAANRPGSLANTMLCFMIVRMFGALNL